MFRVKGRLAKWFRWLHKRYQDVRKRSFFLRYDAGLFQESAPLALHAHSGLCRVTKAVASLPALKSSLATLSSADSWLPLTQPTQPAPSIMSTAVMGPGNQKGQNGGPNGGQNGGPSSVQGPGQNGSPNGAVSLPSPSTLGGKNGPSSVQGPGVCMW